MTGSPVCAARHTTDLVRRTSIAQHSKRYSASNTAGEGSSAQVQDRSAQHGCCANTSNSTAEGWFPTGDACSFDMCYFLCFVAWMTNVRNMALVDRRLLETLRNPMQPPVDTTLPRRGYDEHSRQNRYTSKR